MQTHLDRTRWCGFFAAATMLAAFAVTGSDAQAQSATAERVLHVFVQPKDGNDALAAANNPNTFSDGCTSPTQTPTRPNDYYDPGQGNAKLLNAPYPFKTVTAAIAYIGTLPRGSAQANGSIWKYAIIHCDDGLYAPSGYYTLATSGFHPDNGLQPNGETFPIRLPNYVSIQGTSALNTVFHAGGDQEVVRTSVFQFGMSADNVGTGSFIDKVSIYGVAGQGGFADRSAAIYCGRDYASSPTITNCWIFGNFVGLLLDAPYSEEPSGTWHTVTLTNNTFAWNQCGVWNGMSTTPELETSWGISRLIALNNIFDSNQTLTQESTQRLPSFWITFGLSTGIRSCFEAVAREDLTVASTAGSGGPSGRDFNAYEARPQQDSPSGFGGYNWGDALQLGIVWLPFTRVAPWLNQPMVPGSLPSAAVNLSSITGNQSADASSGSRDADRGTLYVRDLFYNGTRVGLFNPVPGSNDFDRCMGDFRLSPGEADFTVGPAAPNQPLAAHRLVDAGWYPVPSVSEFPLIMQNGLQLGTTATNGWPGYLTLAFNDQPTWVHHNWQFDCEGIGNARAWDHPDYSNTGYGGIDIGADELGGLIVAGYRFGTTHLFKITDPNLLPGTAGQPIPMEQNFVWYLGIPQTSTADNVHSRPWWRKQPDTMPVTPVWAGVWNWSGTGMTYYFPPLHEITPHLLNDIHPYWAQFPPLSASNPLWQRCLAIYNPALFWDPVFGVMNPPGIFPVIGTAFQWLDGQISLATSSPPVYPVDYGQAPIGTNPVRNALFTHFDEWCAARLGGGPRYDALNPTFSTIPTSFRYSVEYSYSDVPTERGPMWARYGVTWPEHNIQSFLVLVEPEQQQGGGN